MIILIILFEKICVKGMKKETEEFSVSFALCVIHIGRSTAIQRGEQLLHHAHPHPAQGFVGVGPQMGCGKEVGQRYKGIVPGRRLAGKDVAACANGNLPCSCSSN